MIRREGAAAIEKLGRYNIIRELGKGAMGVVYLARDPMIGRLVALKTLRAPEAGESVLDLREFHDRFLREAQAAGNLSHPNIVTLHDVGEDPDEKLSFIAMEFVQGKTLKARLAEAQPFLPSEVVDVATQIAEALDYAHRKGIVHRDIKPANVILTEEGLIKIADFGIARILSSSLTTEGHFMGTPKYMSPEQIRGSPVDGRSDLFSLGMLLYEMLTRRTPFPGDNMTTISYKIAHSGFSPPSSVVADLPAEFDRIVAKALAKEPWNRYQRGKDMSADLRQLNLLEDVFAMPATGDSESPVGIDTRPTPLPTSFEAANQTMPAAPAPDSDQEEDTAPRLILARPPSGAHSRPGSGAHPRVESGPQARPASEIVARPPSGARPAASATKPRFRLPRPLAAAAAGLFLVALAASWYLAHSDSAPAPGGGADSVPRRLHPRKNTGAIPNLFPDTEETTPEPKSDSPAAPAGQSGIRVLFSSSLPRGSLHITSNGRTILDSAFEGAPAGGEPRSLLDRTIPLKPGEVVLNVTLAASGGFRGVQSIQGELRPGETRTLHVAVFKSHLVASLNP
jgi:serine/threonine protein kinase